MRVVNDFEQNTPEWQQFRLGKLTGSRLASIWSSRPYTIDDVKKLLTERGVDLDEYKKEVVATKKAAGIKPASMVKADLEKLLSEEDKEMLSIDQEKKLEWYQVLADQFAITWEEDERKFAGAMDRGHELEDEAAMAFASRFDKELETIGCVVSEVDDRIINSPDRYVKRPGKTKYYKEAVEVKCLNAAKHLMCWFERKIPEEYWTQKVQYFITNEKLETLYWVFYNPRLPLLPLFVLVVKREDLGHWPETMTKYQVRTLKEIDTYKARLIDEAEINIMMPAKPEKGIVNADSNTVS